MLLYKGIDSVTNFYLENNNQINVRSLINVKILMYTDGRAPRSYKTGLVTVEIIGFVTM